MTLTFDLILSWLDEGEGDGKLERELLKAPSDDKPKGKGKKK